MVSVLLARCSSTTNANVNPKL